MRYSRRTLNKIRIFIVKVITAIMGIIFMCCLSASPDSNLLVLFPVMFLSGGWLYLVAYVNGWIMDTEPWYEREKREGHDMY